MLKKNLLANYFGQIFTAVVAIAFVPEYIHLLGIESYGLIGIFTIFQVWLNILNMGITPALSREMTRYSAGTRSIESIHNLLRSIEIVFSCISLGIIAVLFFSSNWLANNWLKAENLTVNNISNVISIIGLILALQFIGGIYKGSLAGLQHQVSLNIILSGFGLIRAVGAVGVLILFSPTIIIFFVWQFILELIILMVLIFWTYNRLPRKLTKSRFLLIELRNISKFAKGMFLISILSLLLVQVDKIIISRLIPLTDYGYYTLSTTLASGLFLLAIPISQAFGPQLTKLRELGNDKALNDAYHLGSQLMSIIVGSTSAVLIFYSDWIVLLWTGNEALKDKSDILVSILTFGNMLNCLMWIPYQGQLAYAWTDFSIKVNCLAILVLIPLIILITPLYGAKGAAIIWVALNTGYIVFAIHFMHKKIFLKEKIDWYLMDVLAPITTSFIFVLFFRFIFLDVILWYQRIMILMIVLLGSCLVSIMASNIVRKKFIYILFPNR